MPPQQKINLDNLPDQVDLTELPDKESTTPTPTMPDANAALKSGLGTAWNWANRSIFGVEEPTPEEMQQPGMSATVRKGVAMMTTPLSLAGELAGGIGALKGISRLRNVMGKSAAEVAPIASKEGDILGSQVLGEIPKPATGIPPIKPRVRVNLDGTFTNLDTGEILNPKQMMQVPFEPNTPVKMNLKGIGKNKLEGTIGAPPNPP